MNIYLVELYTEIKIIINKYNGGQKMKMSKLKIYSNPLKTKNCELCNKEIAKSWPDELCEECRTKLELYPEKLKDIVELFKKS